MITTESVAKDRTRLTRSIVLALRELMTQGAPDQHTRDLAAYIALALDAVNETVDRTVIPWEKRGYWLKADRFRLDWAWCDRLSKAIGQAVLNDDWATVAVSAAQVAEKLGDLKVPQRHRLGEPWSGAWKEIQTNAEKFSGS